MKISKMSLSPCFRCSKKCLQILHEKLKETAIEKEVKFRLHMIRSRRHEIVNNTKFCVLILVIKLPGIRSLKCWSCKYEPT